MACAMHCCRIDEERVGSEDCKSRPAGFEGARITEKVEDKGEEKTAKDSTRRWTALRRRLGEGPGLVASLWPSLVASPARGGTPDTYHVCNNYYGERPLDRARNM